jgi:Cu+-exporting ATPase
MPAFESSSLLIMFVLLGKYLEAKAKARTSEALSSLARLAPADAALLDGGVERRVPLILLQRGDRVLVRPGERVPADGVVLKGASSCDEAMLTGESAPVPKSLGDKVIGGTGNIDGALEVEVGEVGDAATLSQIIRLIESAQSSKAPIQAYADWIAGRFVPVVLVCSAATLTICIPFGRTGRSQECPQEDEHLRATVFDDGIVEHDRASQQHRRTQREDGADGELSEQQQEDDEVEML